MSVLHHVLVVVKGLEQNISQDDTCLGSDFKSKVCTLYQDTPIHNTANNVKRYKPISSFLLLLIKKLGCMTAHTKHDLYF